MIVRLVALAAALASAPLQCGHPADANLEQDETPGDALWQLSLRFKQSHDDAAARRTLEYLVQRYPASRWALAAREELSRDGAAASKADD